MTATSSIEVKADKEDIGKANYFASVTPEVLKKRSLYREVLVKDDGSETDS